MPSTSRRPPAWVLVALVACLLVVVWAATLQGIGDGGGSGAAPTAVAPPASGTGSGGASATVTRATPDSGLATIAESELPAEADTTLALVRAGGPYPYEEDDGTFGNRERILPRRAAGYYREYTVETPGEGDRGPRRIVAGAQGDLYWTDDHYASFRQIQEGR